MSFIILYDLYFKKSHAPFKALITQGGKEGGVGGGGGGNYRALRRFFKISRIPEK